MLRLYSCGFHKNVCGKAEYCLECICVLSVCVL